LHHFLKSAMTADAVARIGHSAFRKGRVVAIAGLRNKIPSLAVRCIPRFIVRKVVKRLNAASCGTR
jgi:short-subunit dehydrogenase